MRTPLSAGERHERGGRGKIQLKASHHRFSLRVSHRRDQTSGGLDREAERERYIAPPKRRR